MAAIRKQRTEVLVGTFVTFGLLVMAILIWQFGRFTHKFQEKYDLKVSFTDAGSIIEGVPIKLGGVKVGIVSGNPQHNEDYTRAIIPLEIYEGVRIPVGSSFSIASSGLMGDQYIRIESPEKPDGEYIEPGTEIEGGSPGGLEAIQNNAERVLENAEQVLLQINDAVIDMQTALASLNSTFTKIDKNLMSEENLGNFKNTLAELRASSENIKTATEKLSPLLDEGKAAATEAKTTFEKAGKVMDSADELIAKAEPAVEDLEPTIAELKATLEKASQTMDEIQAGDGLLGALVADSELRKNFEDLIANLKSHGILRYKDDARAAETKAGAAKGDDDGGWFSRSRR